MRNGRVAAWLASVLAMLMAQSAIANATPKLAIFPIDMSFPQSEEDFYSGKKGPTPDEQRRLTMARDELEKLIGAKDRYEVVDIGPIATEITAAQPIYECNGCEIDLAAKTKADLVMTGLMDKISETHLSLTVAIIDVSQSKLVNTASVLIQGNTDESWMHGVRWLVKNRLLAEDKSK
jgi:hypothetical protein